LRSLCSDLQIPIWLHADVLALTDITEDKAPVDADTFISLSRTILPRDVIKVT
jgi:Uncharacterized conserved protein (DUF2181)